MEQYKLRHYPESAFGGFTDVDGTITFYTRVNSLLQPGFVVVDFGCGRGSFQEDPVAIRRELRRLKGKVSRVVGIDVDEAGRENQSLDEFRMLAADRKWPCDDGSVDLILCDWVVEHLPDPPSFFAEARRVLRRGGYLCVRTPNAHGYVALFSRLVPNHLHAQVVTKVNQRRKQEDVFPTLYRCNTIRRLRRTLQQSGFRTVVYGFDAEPAYMNFARVAYVFGVLYQRLAPNVFKNAIFAFAQAE